MKLRNGFVSNSSSCSFTINKKQISPVQLMLIKGHREYAPLISKGIKDFTEEVRKTDWESAEVIFNAVPYLREIKYYIDEWSIEEDDGSLKFWTAMDNFDMLGYLKIIGVPEEAISDKEF